MRLFIRFGAVKSAAYFWINEHFLGYNQDSKTAVEFEITDYVNSTANTLAVEAFRYSDGSYLECQDFWRLSGIEREVCLIARPQTYIRDVFLKSSYQHETKTGAFNFSIDIQNIQQANGTRLKVTLYEKSGQLIDEVLSTDLISTQQKYSGNISIPDLLPWNAETPNLYYFLISLENERIEAFYERHESSQLLDESHTLARI